MHLSVFSFLPLYRFFKKAQRFSRAAAPAVSICARYNCRPIINDDAIRAISSIGLAHLGDAVYELLVRTYLCVHGKATGKGLHRATVELVCAPQQARFAEKLLPLLTEEEASVFRRGRNANVHSVPHHADRADYQKATGLEALFGWLYLRDDHARINELFNLMMEDDDAT